MVQNTNSGGGATNGKGTTGSNHGNNGGGKGAPNEKGSEASVTRGQGMPEHLTRKDLCALCDKPIKKGHRFILQCDKLKTMPENEVKQFFNRYGCRCMLCFSKLHNASDCILTKASCKAVMGNGPNKGQVCGKKHHKSLHSEKRNGNRGNSSQQTQASGGGNETTHPGGASGAGTS